MMTIDERLQAKCRTESELPPVVHTLWGLDDRNVSRNGSRFHHNGPIYQVVVDDINGDRHEDWVAAGSPKEALDILADNVEAWFRDKSRTKPNLYKARANRKVIERFELEDTELIRLGRTKLAFVDGQITHLLFRFGWELPKNWQFKLP